MADNTHILTLIAFGLPAYLVLRAKRYGVPLGAGALWLLVFLCGEASPTWSRSFMQEHPAALEEWLMGGWAFGLIYSFLLWLAKQTWLMFRRGRILYLRGLRVGLSSATSFGRIWRELNHNPNNIGSPINTAYYLAASKSAPRGVQVRETAAPSSSLNWAR